MRGRDQKRTRIRNRRAARVGKESQILSVERRLEKLGYALRWRVDIERREIDRLQRMLRPQRLDEQARRLGCLDHEVPQAAREVERAPRKHFLCRNGAEQVWDEIQPAGHGTRWVKGPARPLPQACRSSVSGATRSVPSDRRWRCVRRARSRATRI